MIWGYAENGVGFIVGCVSTLRPLFRKIFHLGGQENSNNGRYSNGGGGGGGGNSSERGGGCSSLPLAVELRNSSHGDPYYIGEDMMMQTQGKTRTAVTSSQVDYSGKGSSVSGESEEYILQEVRGGEGKEGKLKMGDLDGIQVSRSVHQRRD